MLYRSDEPAWPGWRWLLVLVPLWVASSDVLGRVIGPWGLAAYAALVLALPFAWGRAARLLSRRGVAPAAVIVSVAALAALLLIVLPIADSGRFGGGSDADDALDLAATRLLAGQYPYSQPTYLGNPIAQLPGGVLLALPLAPLGNAGALLNVVSMAAAFWTVRGRGAERWLGPAVLVLILMMLCPGSLEAWVTGNDRLANAVFVSLGAMWLIHAARRPGGGQLVAAALAFGVLLSWRPNFLVALPLILGVLWEHDPRRAIGATVVSVGMFAAVTFPFWIWGGDAFSPLQTTGKLWAFDSRFPHGGIFAVAVDVSLACWLAWRLHCRGGAIEGLLRSLAVVVFVPVAAAALIACWRTGWQGWTYYSSYALLAAVPAVIGSLTWLTAPRTGQPGSASVSEPRGRLKHDL